ncbi:MAG: RNA polymerase sigma factor [Rhizobiaceae bacterium]|nr:RNA polymerase sigma factor [Rhizobiaceae bacterium]
MLPLSTPKQAIERTVREEWGRILASLVKSIGDFQLAEDSLQEALTVALDNWNKKGLPKSPAAWLLTTARRKAIGRLRRDKNFSSKQKEIAYLMDLENMDKGGRETSASVDDPEIPDKRLEMIFTCCHPALEQKTRIALTLRTLGGLTTEEIAAAFLDRPQAMAQRLVRAKNKIKLAGIPYEIPDMDVLPERISSVLSVIYLIFNEGYSASSGDRPVRSDLCDEAIRLARIITQLLPNEAEVAGLLALMLLHDSRRLTRTDGSGALIALQHQNRRRWDRGKINQGVRLLHDVLPRQHLGPYQLQAAISAVHAQSESWEATDWAQVQALYALLYQITPTPVVRLNQALALSYANSPQEGLHMLREAAGDGVLENYQPFHAAKADLLLRNGQIEEAMNSYRRAIELSDNLSERRFLEQKLDDVSNTPSARWS